MSRILKYVLPFFIGWSVGDILRTLIYRGGGTTYTLSPSPLLIIDAIMPMVTSLALLLIMMELMKDILRLG